MRAVKCHTLFSDTFSLCGAQRVAHHQPPERDAPSPLLIPRARRLSDYSCVLNAAGHSRLYGLIVCSRPLTFLGLEDPLHDFSYITQGKWFA